jgi:hypothetical protein
MQKEDGVRLEGLHGVVQVPLGCEARRWHHRLSEATGIDHLEECFAQRGIGKWLGSSGAKRDVADLGEVAAHEGVDQATFPDASTTDQDEPRRPSVLDAIHEVSHVLVPVEHLFELLAKGRRQRHRHLVNQRIEPAIEVDQTIEARFDIRTAGVHQDSFGTTRTSANFGPA